MLSVKDGFMALAPLIGLAYSLPLLPLVLKRGVRRLLGYKEGQPIVASEAVTAALSDSRWGEHKFVEANGLRFHYVEAGHRDAPLVLFLHGFPEFWYSWRHQLEALKGSCRCVAIDMRGYGLSDKPDGIEAYASEKLVEDIAALIDVLGGGEAVVVGHDWGGNVAWFTAHMYPEKVMALCVMNCPHPRAFMRNASFRQFFRSWYMMLYQLPWLPELFLSDANYRAITMSFVGRSMGIKRTGPHMSRTDVDCMVYAFSQPGVATAAVNYYRNMRRIKSKELVQAMRKRLEMPVMLIWGELDGALGKEMTNGTEYYVKDLRLEFLPASHWVQNDAVPEVNSLLLEFLGDHGLVRRSSKL